MDSRSCVITGGNSGIGRAAAVQLARAGHRVTIACRNEERGNDALRRIRTESGSDSVRLRIVDLSLQESIRRFAEAFTKEHESLDVLIHNAADFDIGRKKPLYTSEGVESVWATNHLGPVLLTKLLRRLLEESTQGRVITVASKGLLMYPRLEVDLVDPEFRHRSFSVQKAYYQAKLAQVMFTYWLAGELKETRATANCIRVTNVKIDISRYPNLSAAARLAYSLKGRFSISPDEMARAYVAVATSEDFASTSGRYVDEKCGAVESSPYSRDPENIRLVMELTEKYFK